MRAPNLRLFQEAAARVRGSGEQAVYLIFVDEIPGLFFPPKVGPSREAQEVLAAGVEFFRQADIVAVPVWRMAHDAGASIAGRRPASGRQRGAGRDVATERRLAPSARQHPEVPGRRPAQRDAGLDLQLSSGVAARAPGPGIIERAAALIRLGRPLFLFGDDPLRPRGGGGAGPGLHALPAPLPPRSGGGDRLPADDPLRERLLRLRGRQSQSRPDPLVRGQRRIAPGRAVAKRGPGDRAGAGRARSPHDRVCGPGGSCFGGGGTRGSPHGRPVLGLQRASRAPALDRFR